MISSYCKDLLSKEVYGMNDIEVHQLYEQGLKELNFDQCMKAVGVLYEKGHPDAVWLEAEVLYLRQEYENCLITIGRHRKKNSFELNEYYLACLLMLGRHFDLRLELSNLQKYHISWQCAAFIDAMMRKRGESLPSAIKGYDYSSSPFQRVHLEFVVQEMIDLYELQIDQIQLKLIGVLNQGSGQGPDLKERIAAINISDNNITMLKNAIESERPIDPSVIVKFFKKYFGPGLQEERPDGRKGQLRDVLTLFNLERRLRLFSELEKSFNEYKESLSYAIEKGNRIAAGHLKEILFDLESTSNNEDYIDIIDFIRKRLKKYFPEMLQDEDQILKESRVYQLLHNKTKPMYKAALWQHNMVSLDMDYGFRDAGMYCLAYIRLLECEMNQRVFPIIENHYHEIDEKAAELSSKQKNKLNISRFNPARSDKDVKLTAGQWNSFLDAFRAEEFTKITQRSPDFASLMSCIMREEVFNELGYNKLTQGRIADLFDQNLIVKKYRNPPAHTKYVTISIANECRGHVENCIIELAGYYK